MKLRKGNPWDNTRGSIALNREFRLNMPKLYNLIQSSDDKTKYKKQRYIVDARLLI